MWSNTNPASGHGSFLSPDSLPGHLFARRHVREETETDRTALRPQVQVQIRSQTHRLTRHAVTATRPRSKRSERTALRPEAERQIPPQFRIDIVTLPRHVACQSSMHPEPHSVLPIHCRTSTRNRHRRSTWAGVSWPNDDGIGESVSEHIGRTLAATRTARCTRGVTRPCEPSSEYLRARRRASSSRRN